VQQLNLHKGGELVTLDQLRAVPVPSATESHMPLPHIDLVSMVKYALGYFGHEVVEEHHAIDYDGMRYFGLMTLRSPYSDYADTVGLRNSNDRTFPIGIAFGSQVFVCSNLAFVGDHVIKRKHTANSKRDLPGLVAEVIEPLQAQRIAQNQKLLHYQASPISDAVADHAIMEMYRRDVIGVQRIADVHEQWQNPTHEWGSKTAWRLFNAATFALAGKVTERPDLTRQLHTVIDSTCERLH
jgi:hypothetical protein